MYHTIFQQLSDALDGRLQENVALAPLTTFKIGGKARYLFVAKSAEEIEQALRAAKEAALIPVFLLGGGSNLWISDQGFDGLVIKNEARDIVFEKDSVCVDSGVTWGVLMAKAALQGFTGIAELCHIPGTLGGAVYGNAGSFGKETKDVVKRIYVYRQDRDDCVWIEREECSFTYRSSVFKQKPWIILKVELRLSFGNTLEEQRKTQEYLVRRRSTQPISKACAGCMFKNPAGNFASKLIDECGLKGERVGGAMVSLAHANFIENVGGATSQDVERLVDKVKKFVREKFGIVLKEEVIKVGF